MADNVSRTTISIDPGVMTGGLGRAKALRYKSFSKYIEYLIERDVQRRDDHVVVRTEQPSDQPEYRALPKAAEEPPRLASKRKPALAGEPPPEGSGSQ